MPNHFTQNVVHVPVWERAVKFALDLRKLLPEQLRIKLPENRQADFNQSLLNSSRSKKCKFLISIELDLGIIPRKSPSLTQKSFSIFRIEHTLYSLRSRILSTYFSRKMINVMCENIDRSLRAQDFSKLEAIPERITDLLFNLLIFNLPIRFLFSKQALFYSRNNGANLPH